jgi:hypothetical protein
VSEEDLSSSVEPPKPVSAANLLEDHHLPKEARNHVEHDQEKSCNSVALLAVQMWEHMNDNYAFCNKRTGKIETNPILDFDHQGEI